MGHTHYLYRPLVFKNWEKIISNEEAFIYSRKKIDDFEEKLWKHHPERTLN